jgi:hypothetical protein
MVPATRELVEMAREHKRLGKQAKALEEERDAIGNTLRLAIGDRSGFEWEDGRCTWTADKSGARALRIHIKGERR